MRRSDFDRYAGHVAKVELTHGIDGRKRFRGTLLGTEGDAVRLLRENAPAGEQQEFLLPIEDMAEAKLVLTDALIAEALKRSKAAEREPQEASDEAVSDEAVAGHSSQPFQEIHAAAREESAVRVSTRRLSNGRQRQQARAFADRRCGSS